MKVFEWRVPDNILLEQIAPKITEYDSGMHRLQNIYELQALFNTYQVTVEPLCGFCSKDIVEVIEVFKEVIKKKKEGVKNESTD
jgi:hypothetical protein